LRSLPLSITLSKRLAQSRRREWQPKHWKASSNALSTKRS
jgi:hypothetical protein